MKTSAIAVVSMVWCCATGLLASTETILESFEDGIGNVQPMDWGGGRGADGLVDLIHYSKTAADDIAVTHGERALQITLRERKFWSSDFGVTLSSEASEILKNAAASREEGRYILRYDMLFPATGDLIPWINTTGFIGDRTPGQLEAGPGIRAMSFALDLMEPELPVNGEGQVVLNFASNFDTTENPFTSLDLYLDNIRLVDTYAPGSVPVVTVLDSFEEDVGRASDFTDWGATPRTTYASYTRSGLDDNRVTEGEKSLQVDISGVGAWGADFNLSLKDLASILLLPQEARSRYTLRFDVAFPTTSDQWSGDWYVLAVHTLADIVPHTLGRPAGMEGQTRTFSLQLDQVPFPTFDPSNPEDLNPRLLIINNGPWGADGTYLNIDNLRIIDTANVPLAIRDISADFAAQTVSVSWFSSDRQAYAVDISTSLLEDDWQNLATGIAGASGAVFTTFLHEDPPLDTDLYYRISVSGAAPPLNENFESGLGGWTTGAKATNTGSTEWEAGPPANGPGAAHGGTQCAGTGLESDVTAGSHIFLRSPLVDLTTFLQPVTLSYWHYLDGNGIVAARVTILDENGSELEAPGEGDPGYFTADTGGWEQFSLPVASVGRKVYVEFEFVAADDGGPGWFVDDVLIQE
ncbi:MAG TPA: hypothetical protein VMN36_04640 [Verrucomicrobiales bacterium]|nr:hypothetical protein [Verrucomicrobiales bacterium]